MKSYSKVFAAILILALVGVTLYKSFDEPEIALGAFPGDFTKYQEIQINPGYVGTSIDNFVVYVDLSDLDVGASDLWDTTSNCGDIRITESDGTTEVPREIVSCDTGTKTGELHFKATGTASISSSATTTYRIWYNGTDADYGVTTTYGRDNVWDQYAAVWHMTSDSGTETDVTGNGNTLSREGSPANAVGKVSDAIDFSGTSQSLDTGSAVTGLDTTNGYSYQAWYKADVYTTNLTVMGQYNLPGDSYEEGGFSGSTATWYLVHGLYDGNNTTNVYYNANAGTGASSAVTTSPEDGFAVRIRSGATEGVRAETGSASGDATAFAIGKRVTESLYFNGVIDEVRIAKSNHVNANWISAEYANQNTPSDFYIVTTETDTGGGGGATPIQRQDIFFFSAVLTKQEYA